jgi:hypothetical protein
MTIIFAFFWCGVGPNRSEWVGPGLVKGCYLRSYCVLEGRGAKSSARRRDPSYWSARGATAVFAKNCSEESDAASRATIKGVSQKELAGAARGSNLGWYYKGGGLPVGRTKVWFRARHFDRMSDFIGRCSEQYVEIPDVLTKAKCASLTAVRGVNEGKNA